MKPRTRMRARLVVAALAGLIAQSGWAQLKDENLLVNLPPGYKIDFQTRNGKIVTQEPGSRRSKATTASIWCKKRSNSSLPSHRSRSG
jgi:hypothetical protein